ncbi:MAG: hypothetical protein KKH37_04845 [Alphaproteobacteria bacterium]|nr:hypothetical protein [Alphaproteobacteria bacterium]
MRKFFLTALAGLGTAGALTLAVAPSAAQNASLAMLGQLDRGQWELRFRDGEPSQRICLREGSDLIQLRHRGANCSRLVVENGARQVTVQYTCRGNGYGRTSVRRESATLAQVESQGIAGGRPFQFSAEARRVGACH